MNAIQTEADDLPELMRAFPLTEFGVPDVLRMTNVAVPKPGPGEVLVHVASCGVCGQDIMRRNGKVDHMLGAVMGHEIAGTIAALGPGVTELSPGDRVACTQRRSCHRCPACLRGQTVLCPRGVLYGESVDGGYADYCVIDELSLARIPERVSFDEAAVAACAVGTGWHALRLAQASAGQRVLVTGASGGVGIHAVQLARAMGMEVVAVTSSEAKAHSLAPHADHVVVMADGRFDQQIRQRRLQPDVVLDLTAKHSLSESLRSVQRGGTVVIVGNLENGPVDVLPSAFIIREIRMLGSKACTRDELETCLQLIDRGLVNVQLQGSMALPEAATAHALVESGQIQGRVVLHP